MKDSFSISSETTKTEIAIYFRIPFTMYFLGKVRGKCEHDWSKFYFFIKDFDYEGYKWKLVN